ARGCSRRGPNRSGTAWTVCGGSPHRACDARRGERSGAGSTADARTSGRLRAQASSRTAEAGARLRLQARADPGGRVREPARVREVLDPLLPNQERIDRLGDRALAGRYYFLVGRTYSFLGQYERAAQNAERAIAEARQCRRRGDHGQGALAPGDPERAVGRGA